MKLFFLSVGYFLLVGCSIAEKPHAYLDEKPNGLVQKWVVKTHTEYFPGSYPAEMGSPVLVGPNILQASTGNGLGLYRGFDGKRIWLREMKGGSQATPLPVEPENRVYIGGNDGLIYCLNLSDGGLIWSQELSSRSTSRPSYRDGKIFIQTEDQSLHAFEAETGKKLWSQKRNILSTTILQSTTIRGETSPVVWGDRVIAGFGDGHLVSFRIADGILDWERDLSGTAKFTDVDGTPVLQGDVLIAASYDGNLYRISASKGQILSSFNAGSARAVRLDGETMYLPSSDGNLYALNSKDLSLKWKFKVEKGIPTGVAVIGHELVIPTSRRYVYVLDKTSGEAAFRVDLGSKSGVYSDTVVKGDQLFFFSAFGNLYRYELLPEETRKGRGYAIQ